MPGTQQSSLEEIEGDFWGDAPDGATRLIATVHALRRRPVDSLGIEELRLLAGQQVGLETVVPLALARLEQDPLAEGDFYPGDLLVAVLRVPAEHWRGHPEQAARLRSVVEAVGLDQVDADIREDIAAFRGTGY